MRPVVRRSWPVCASTAPPKLRVTSATMSLITTPALKLAALKAPAGSSVVIENAISSTGTASFCAIRPWRTSSSVQRVRSSSSRCGISLRMSRAARLPSRRPSNWRKPPDSGVLCPASARMPVRVRAKMVSGCSIGNSESGGQVAVRAAEAGRKCVRTRSIA
jgi:hypothetical protein